MKSIIGLVFNPEGVTWLLDEAWEMPNGRDQLKGGKDANAIEQENSTVEKSTKKALGKSQRFLIYCDFSLPTV